MAKLKSKIHTILVVRLEKKEEKKLIKIKYQFVVTVSRTETKATFLSPNSIMKHETKFHQNRNDSFCTIILQPKSRKNKFVQGLRKGVDSKQKSQPLKSNHI